MIVNRPETRNYEGPKHMAAKIRIAKLVDSLLEKEKEKNPDWIVNTIYEYFFPTLLTTLGDKHYRADVFFDVSYPLEHQLRRHTMSVELDGKFGHWGDYEQMKDHVRDENLLEKLNCAVVRLETHQVTGYKRKKPSLHPDIRMLTDEELLEALDPIKNMKL
jgi:hypothetical protein